MNAAWKYTVDQGMGAFSDEMDKDSPLIMLSDREAISSDRAFALPHCLWADASFFYYCLLFRGIQIYGPRLFLVSF